mgnify:FL=1
MGNDMPTDKDLQEKALYDIVQYWSDINMMS